MNVFKGKTETPKVLESFIKSPKSMQQYIIMHFLLHTCRHY